MPQKEINKKHKTIEEKPLFIRVLFLYIFVYFTVLHNYYNESIKKVIQYSVLGRRKSKRRMLDR